MSGTPGFVAFLARNPGAVLAELSRVRGSSPRAEGTVMAIGADALAGTIGGGALEHMVIAHARRLMAGGQGHEIMDVPLGPEIGQCCGGRVEVRLSLLDADRARALDAADAGRHARRPAVFIFGAGHVGRALSHSLSPLPFRVTVIDQRASELVGLGPGAVPLPSPLPEAVVRAAPPGSAVVIVTHDHALDFLIAREALARPDLFYVGMVGSRTKRARFAHWYYEGGGSRQNLDRLLLPIGASGTLAEALGDKRPEVIAALCSAEILVKSAQREALETGVPATVMEGADDGR